MDFGSVEADHQVSFHMTSLIRPYKKHINKANSDIFLRWKIPEDTFKVSRDTNQYEELK